MSPFAGRIAIFGYGSLIWDLDDLAPKVEGAWRMEGGPELPLEFSRISSKRLMSLVVVIDPDHGAPCPSHAILSRRNDVEEAQEDLRLRERAPEGFTGAVCARRGVLAARDARTGALVADWMRANGAVGAVWADLDANFAAETGQPFSIAAGLAYLRGLSGAGAAEARRYIGGAPAQTDTPLRRALAAEAWWRAG